MATSAPRRDALELCFFWGSQRLAAHVIPLDTNRSFAVGDQAGVDFAMAHLLLGAHSFDVAQVENADATIHFTPLMHGVWHRPRGESISLADAVTAGQTTFDGENHSIQLGNGESVTLQMQNITLRASPVTIEPLAHSPETFDFRAANIFLATSAAAALFIIAAPAAEVRELSDDLELSRAARYWHRPPPPPPPPARPPRALARPDTSRRLGRQPPPAASTRTGAARPMLARLFSGNGWLGAAQPLGEDLRKLAGNIRLAGDLGPGLTSKETGNGADDLSPVGIGNVRTPGGAPAKNGDWGPIGMLGKKPLTPIPQDFGDGPINVTGALDRSLIRDVIRRHRSEIRYCYEELLNRFPDLQGTVAVKFTIAASGDVSAAQLAHSNLRPELEQCVVSRVRRWAFPKPRGGGVVIVTYPFVFRPAGQ